MALKKLFTVVTFMTLLGSSAAADSAFGIEYGGELPKGAQALQTAGMYRVTEPPKPHSLFEGYTVQYTPETGVCWIRGYSITFENDKYGNKVKEAYNKLALVLNEKYGPKGDTWEELEPNALWDEPDEFARSLIAEDRSHLRWFKPTANKNTDFDYVQMKIYGLDSTSTYLDLQYMNKRLRDKCNEILSRTDDDSL